MFRTFLSAFVVLVGLWVAAPLQAQVQTGDVTSSILMSLPHSTTRPATCRVGDIYMDTDASSGQRLYLCESANTWVAQGGGGGGGGTPGGSAAEVQFNDGGSFGGVAAGVRLGHTDLSIREGEVGRLEMLRALRRRHGSAKETLWPSLGAWAIVGAGLIAPLGSCPYTGPAPWRI